MKMGICVTDILPYVEHNLNIIAYNQSLEYYPVDIEFIISES